MLIHFQLRDIAAIAPFGGEQPVLHWFGLSDGWYWLSVGDTELFRFSQRFMQQEEPWRSNPGTLPYVDYYVMRLWEDLLDQLPAMLTPLPAILAERVADASAWQRWQDEARQWLDRHDSDSASDRFLQAFKWWDARRLDTGYLRNGPLIWCWRSGDTVHLRWDNRREEQRSYPVWSADYGEEAFSVATFLEEIRDFDTRFMAGMAEQVTAARQHWPNPGIAIDHEQLVREQDERRGWLTKSMARLARGENEDWSGIVAAIDHIERDSAD